ncbi:MAG: alkaline phosphatase family protein [Candidatus Methylumidiphilus sp.]
MRYSRLALPLALALSGLPSAHAAPPPKGLDKIGHIVVIYLENHSYDNLYGLFPDAEGIAQAKPENTTQVDLNGQPFATLPPVPDDPRFPKDLPNKPFLLDDYAPPEEKVASPTHLFYQHQQQINGGAMNLFAAVSEVKGLVMGHYDGHKLPLWQYAKRFTLADHFFQAAFGGSFLNHQWLACACTPRYDNAPDSLKAVLDAQGKLVKDGTVTPDGYAVNTILPAEGPHPDTVAAEKLLPVQTAPTLGDRLSDRRIDWAWYSGGWNDAQAGHPDPTFQFHHQPYAYFQRYTAGSPGRAQHLKDEADLLAGIAKGQLPPVVFYKPVGSLNEHPGYADVMSGEKHIADILDRLEHSPLWKDSVIIVTYDENGGFWDHVPPPKGDRFGPGSRIPAIIISPFVRNGYVDHSVYDTTSILKLIEERYRLRPLTDRDAQAQSLAKALRL